MSIQFETTRKCTKFYPLHHGVFMDLKDEQIKFTSEDFYNCDEKVCSDETHGLTCGMVKISFSCTIYHETNPMKQGWRVVL